MKVLCALFAAVCVLRAGTALGGVTVPTTTVAPDRVALLISHPVYIALKPYIQHYKVDVEARVPVQLHVVEGAWGNPAEVRATIKSLHADEGIVGVILVGAPPMHHFFMHEHANPWTKSEQDHNGPNCAMSWVFGKHLGQAVIAQVRSGGIGGDDIIYARLRAGDYLGKAYLPCKQAHEIEASLGDHIPGDIVSGILMIGNPFLALKPVKRERDAKARLVIRNAVYGDLANNAVVNVTQKVADWVEDSLTVVATNDHFGDPADGIVKQLKVDYTLDGREASETVNEGDTLKIRK